MKRKSLVFILTAHEGYMRQFGTFKFTRTESETEGSKIVIEDTGEGFSVIEDRLFRSIAQTYVPLLNMFSSLSRDKVPFKMSLVISPTLCAELSDEYVKARYVKWLEERIDLGKKELMRCTGDIKKRAQKCLAEATQSLVDFTEVYNSDILGKFKEYEEKGYIELLATTATYAYLPHYADIQEAVNAQIEVGIQSHKQFFGTQPDGFWLPHLGYANNISKTLRAYNVNYTVVDARSVLFSEKRANAGIFEPVRTDGFVAVLANDTDFTRRIENYKEAPEYLANKRDIGYEIEIENIEPFISPNSPRIQTGYKYYDGNDEVYSEAKAFDRVEKDAADFVASVEKKLEKAYDILYPTLPENYAVIDVCTIDTANIGREWNEGISFLEKSIRSFAQNGNIDLESAKDIVDRQLKLQKIDLYPCSAIGTGFGENLLGSTNDWLLKYARRAVDRMIDLAERFPTDTGIKARLLNLASREILLSQSSEWANLMNDNSFSAFAEKSFTENISAFSTVYESLGSNSVSTEWLTTVEREHPIFPWINYRVFSKKK